MARCDSVHRTRRMCSSTQRRRFRLRLPWACARAACGRALLPQHDYVLVIGSANSRRQYGRDRGRILLPQFRAAADGHSFHSGHCDRDGCGCCPRSFRSLHVAVALSAAGAGLHRRPDADRPFDIGPPSDSLSSSTCLRHLRLSRSSSRQSPPSRSSLRHSLRCGRLSS
jgi:hypothetical protein